ncbi:RsmB/NOP family class I SAM-dependent RNA methyltransferase [Paracoccus sp. Z330]|uniref:RsmB/NOP family class I SAM-dependent RNA methyltransferase n=1 Tax=Paracoccus onchidii TaxID=3017813 RepID=A0ABT4Z9J8_9RHOB|nr:RsmB/NOP family class I SAM-dependent RNA methyltransferase [Paracoccus onchidii]MDB6176017.1 RsmB/NOP family class I SAM-dependent RNA methyltransferase [Paracoccus onchidii]
MNPAARIAAAIDILDRILAGEPAEPSLLRWSRASRFAGSGDRAAVRDLVFDALRRRNTLAALGGDLSGRGLMIGRLRDLGTDPETVFTGSGHAPSPLGEHERRMPEASPAIDLPEWVVPRWRNSLGAQADDIAILMGQRAPVWLRVNPVRATVRRAMEVLAAGGIETVEDDRLPGALRVIAGERKVARNAAYLGGMVELQDLSPQLACAALPLRPGDRVLDYCAGGGGKSLALIGRQPDLRVEAHDADPARMQDLPARASRAGVSVLRVDAPSQRYQLVVADVPCSGSGTWRRSPDAKWRLDEAALDNLVATQAEILDRVSDLVAPGGCLAYMTCSLLAEENGAQIDAFLERDDGYTRMSQCLWTPIDASDGFFLSVLRRHD